MRQAFAACLALAVLMVIVVVRCGFRDDSPAPDASVPPLADAAIADAPSEAASAVRDAAPPPTQRVPKPGAKPPRPAPKRPQPAPKPTPTPPPAITTPLTPPPEPPAPRPPAPQPTAPGSRQCIHPPNPAGCPAKEPNVNRPCDAEGVHCVYGTSCCPFEYVCKGGAFEVWITSCP